ncbi:hypothetical protein LTR85_001520 [Meristemomyces frigidus]|nr:hypothetical protein LTR85_001520 [Meristemomyces frigidus]
MSAAHRAELRAALMALSGGGDGSGRSSTVSTSNTSRRSNGASVSSPPSSKDNSSVRSATTEASTSSPISSEDGSSISSVTTQSTPACRALTDITRKVDSLAIVATKNVKKDAIVKVHEKAALRLFAKAELLEFILVRADLGLPDLFILRRVAKSWKRTIEGSRSLQLQSYTFNPAKPTRNTPPSRVSLFVDEKLLNTLITKTGYAHFAHHGRPNADYANPQAFWRTLSVFSPPAATAYVRVGYFKNPNNVEKVVRCANYTDAGVTLEDVWKAVVDTMRTAGRRGGRGQPELDRVEVSTDARGTFKWAPGVVHAEGGGGYYSLVANTSTGSAVQQVFAITELLEAIISHLPVRNIIGVHRVCRKSHDVLQHTNSLQQKVFAITTRVSMPTEKIKGLSMPDLYPLTQEEAAAIQMPLSDAEINPLLPAALEHMSCDSTSSAWKRPEASWRKLSLFFPAAHKASFACDAPFCRSSGTIRSEKGVTLGDASNKLEQLLMQNNEDLGFRSYHVAFTVDDAGGFRCGWQVRPQRQKV